MKFNRDLFFTKYREKFTRLNQKQVDGLNILLDLFENTKEIDLIQHISYMLATIYHETAKSFQPITEFGKRSYFDKYNGRYGNNNIDDGYKYRGRGYVQLTFKANYERASKELSKLLNTNVDLISDPDLVLNHKISGNILILGMKEGWFTGKKLTDYINSSKTDYINARRIINGTDRARNIAKYADDFQEILEFSLEK